MKTIITIGYDNFVSDNVDVGEIIGTLSSLRKVSQSGYGADAIYVPEEHPVQISVQCVRDTMVRQRTTEEQESKDITSLKYVVTNLEEKLKEAEEKTKDLECVNKALCEQTEGNAVTDAETA